MGRGKGVVLRLLLSACRTCAGEMRGGVVRQVEVGNGDCDRV